MTAPVKLTAAGERALRQLASGTDSGLHPACAASLCAKGFAVSHKEWHGTLFYVIRYRITSAGTAWLAAKDGR